MERSLYYVRLFPGTEARYDAIHRQVPGAVRRGMVDAGLNQVSGFRRGTDVWWYAEAHPDRDTAFSRSGKGIVNRRWGHQFRDVIAEIEAPGGGLMWYEEVFHAEGPPASEPCQRGLISLVIDPHRAQRYDELHADPWPEMLQALVDAGHRDYTGFRRGAHVVYVGRFCPDVETVIDRLGATAAAARWSAALEGVVTTMTDAAGRPLTATEIYHQE